MTRRAGLLFPAALSFSAVAHLLALFLWPYSPAPPALGQPEPIPVRLLAAPRPPPQAARGSRAVRPETTPQFQPAPAPREPEPETAASVSPLELAPPEPAAAGATKQHTEEPAAQEGPPGPVSVSTGLPAAAGAPRAPAAEIAGTQAVLSSLRGRILEHIHYPALARANNWQGTVLLEMLLDGEGRLEGLAVRRSSGYTVLDRAAAALVRSVTPVENPLGRPLRIEVPIDYELKD
jgi:protein TonB